MARAADALRPVAHARDVPLVVADHFRLAARLGLDGVHLTDGPRQVRAAREALGRDAIVGAFARASRHDGLTAAEIGADYVSLRPRRPDRPRRRRHRPARALPMVVRDDRGAGGRRGRHHPRGRRRARRAASTSSPSATSSGRPRRAPRPRSGTSSTPCRRPVAFRDRVSVGRRRRQLLVRSHCTRPPRCTAASPRGRRLSRTGPPGRSRYVRRRTARRNAPVVAQVAQRREQPILRPAAHDAPDLGARRSVTVSSEPPLMWRSRWGNGISIPCSRNFSHIASKT